MKAGPSARAAPDSVGMGCRPNAMTPATRATAMIQTTAIESSVITAPYFWSTRAIRPTGRTNR